MLQIVSCFTGTLALSEKKSLTLLENRIRRRGNRASRSTYRHHSLGFLQSQAKALLAHLGVVYEEALRRDRRRGFRWPSFAYRSLDSFAGVHRSEV